MIQRCIKKNRKIILTLFSFKCTRNFVPEFVSMIKHQIEMNTFFLGCYQSPLHQSPLPNGITSHQVVSTNRYKSLPFYCGPFASKHSNRERKKILFENSFVPKSLVPTNVVPMSQFGSSVILFFSFFFFD